MQYETNLLIVKFDDGGLIIIRKHGDFDEPATISLTAEESSQFAMMFSMGNGAVAGLMRDSGNVGLTASGIAFLSDNTTGDEESE